MEYRTMFGKNATDGDYVARVSVVQRMWGGASGDVIVGKLHKGYIYYGKSIKRSTAAYTDLICVVDPADIPARKQQAISEAILQQEEADNQKPVVRYFKLRATYIDKLCGIPMRKITQTTFAKTQTLRADAKRSDIDKWARNVYRKQREYDPNWSASIREADISFEEYLDEEAFIRDKKNITWEEKYRSEKL